MTEELTYLAMHLREQDALEVSRSTSRTIRQAVIDSWDASEFRKLYRNESEQPIAVVGVVRAGEGQGIPWMLATSEVNEMPATLHRESKRVLRHLQSKYETLSNLVDAENSIAIQWLEVLGFKLEKPIPFGPFNLPFIPFGWSR